MHLFIDNIDYKRGFLGLGYLPLVYWALRWWSFPFGWFSWKFGWFDATCQVRKLQGIHSFRGWAACFLVTEKDRKGQKRTKNGKKGQKNAKDQNNNRTAWQKDNMTKGQKDTRAKGQRDKQSQKYLWSVVLHLRDVYVLVSFLIDPYWVFILPNNGSLLDPYYHTVGSLI